MELPAFSISTLLGTDVINEDGISLGVLEDVIFSPPAERISWFLIASGGFLGEEDELFAISPRYFSFPADGCGLIFREEQTGHRSDFYPELPEDYADIQVRNVFHFRKLIGSQVERPGHRSDNDHTQHTDL